MDTLDASERAAGAALGRLIIADREFRVTDATLMGYLTTIGGSWRCLWHVDVEAEGRDFPPGEDEEYPKRWAPCAYAHHVPADVRSWREFNGLVITGEDEQGDDPSLVRSEPAFRLFVYEHAPIAGNRIKFANRRGDVFDLTWTGNAAIYGGAYWDDIPFRVECEVRFTRVALRLFADDPHAADPDMAAIFAGVLDPTDFRQLSTMKSASSRGAEWNTEFIPAL